MKEQTGAEAVEELRKYNPDGTPVHRYWMGELDKWWDWGFYFHCFILIGVWMLYDALTTGHITPTQFKLNHTITVFWVFAAGIYSVVNVILDMVKAVKKG